MKEKNAYRDKKKLTKGVVRSRTKIHFSRASNLGSIKVNQTTHLSSLSHIQPDFDKEVQPHRSNPPIVFLQRLDHTVLNHFTNCEMKFKMEEQLLLDLVLRVFFNA